MQKKLIVPVAVLLVLIGGLYLYLRPSIGPVSNISSSIASRAVSPYDTELIKFLPQNTSSLTSCTLDNSSARAFENSKEYKAFVDFFSASDKQNTLLSAIPKANTTGDIPEKVQKTLRSIKDSGYKFKLSECAEQLYFQSADQSDSLPVFGVLGKCRDTKNTALLVGAIKKSGLELTEETKNGVTTYQLDISKIFNLSAIQGVPAELKSELIIELILSADRFALGTKSARATLQAFIENKPYESPAPILGSAEYAEARSALAFNPDKHYCITYSDIKTSLAQSAEKLKQQDPAIGAEKVASFLEKFPLQWHVNVVGYDAGFTSETLLGLKQIEDNSDIGRIISELRNAGDNEALKLLPGVVGLALAVNLKPLISIATEYLKKDDPTKQAQLETAKGFDAIGLAVRSTPQSAPFPEVSIISVTKNAEQLLESAKLALGAAIASQLGGQPEWREQEISGAKVYSILTPFGIGVFLTKKDDYLMLSSSSSGIEALLGRASNSTAQNEARLSDFIEKHSVLGVVLNLKDILAIVDGIQSAFGSMTGQHVTLPVELKELFSIIGQLSFQAKIDGQVLKLLVKQKTMLE